MQRSGRGAPSSEGERAMVAPAASDGAMWARTSTLFEELESVDQTCGFRPEFMFGALAADMKRVQAMIEERSGDIREIEERQEDTIERMGACSPDHMFTTIDNLYELTQESDARSLAGEAFGSALKSFEATLLKVAAAMPHLKAAADPPGAVSEQGRCGLITEEHISQIGASLQQLRETEASRSPGKEVVAFAHLLDFRLRHALELVSSDRTRNLPSSRDLDAAWCHRTLQQLQRRDAGAAKSPKSPAQTRLLRWAREPGLVHQSVRQLVKPWMRKAGPKSGHRPPTPGALFRRVPSAPTSRPPADKVALSAAAAEAWVRCVDRSEFSQRFSAKVADVSR